MRKLQPTLCAGLGDSGGGWKEGFQGTLGKVVLKRDERTFGGIQNINLTYRKVHKQHSLVGLKRI